MLHFDWPATSPPSPAERLVAAARDAGFLAVAAGPGRWSGVRGPRAPERHLLADGRLVVFGDVFAASGGPPDPLSGSLSDAALLRALTERCWGRYLAFAHGPDGRFRTGLRDPSGAMELISWTAFPDIRIVCTTLPDWLARLATPPARLDWNAVAAMLIDPGTITGDGALGDLMVAVPGEMVDLQTGSRTPLWRPVQFVDGATEDATTAARELRARLDTVMRSWAETLERPGAEVSGGLDSAIVAASAVQGGLRGKLWLNMFGPGEEADERVYARAVGEGLGLELTCSERGRHPMTKAILAETSDGPRPGLNGRDVAFDIDIARECRRAGIDSLLTGKGGDGLFFQMGVPAIFVDLWRRRGLAALFSPVLPDLARRTRRSAWTILGEALRDGGDGEADRHRAVPFIHPDLAAIGHARVRHPWMRDLEGIGPAKRLQIESVAAALAFNCVGRRTRAVDLIHPILAQPVAEWCLGLSIPLLTAGGEDRGLARAAFENRLPPMVRHRRSKGDLTAFLGRQVAADLPFLREHLLDGRLVQKGLIDRDRLEAALHRDRIQWQGGFAGLTLAAVIESWVRRWEALPTPASGRPASPSASSRSGRRGRECSPGSTGDGFHPSR